MRLGHEQVNPLAQYTALVMLPSNVSNAETSVSHSASFRDCHTSAALPAPVGAVIIVVRR